MQRYKYLLCMEGRTLHEYTSLGDAARDVARCREALPQYCWTVVKEDQDGRQSTLYASTPDVVD